MLLELRELQKNTKEYLGKEIEINGWVKKIRSQKNFGFIELNDGTFFTGIQVVFEEGLENFEEISKLTISTSVKVTGIVVESVGKGQAYEIKATKISVYQKADSDYPLQNKRHSFEFLRTIAHLRPRTNAFFATFRVRSILSYAIHKFFQEKNFVYVQTPIITGSDAEGAGEMFRLTTLDINNIPKTENGSIDFKQDFFGKEANLTVSGQLNVETFATAFKNTYTFGPTFRAEKSNTPKHAAEFWMMEPEIAFADLDVNMDIIEKMITLFMIIIRDYYLEDDSFNELLIEFIYDKKHHKHEDLAFLLEKKHSPKLINCVYDLAVMELDYKKEDEFFNIARKCTYALGYTNTPKAKEKLELLAKNENELIREYAIKQLNRHDFTDKDVEEQD